MIISWCDWHPSCREQQVVSPTDSQNSTRLLLSCHVFPFFLWLKCTCHCKRRNPSPDSFRMPKFSASSFSLGSNSGDWEFRSQKRWSILEDFLRSNQKPFPSQFKNSVEVWPLPLFPNNFFSAEAHFPFETKSSSLSWSFTMELFCTHSWIVLSFPGGSEVKASACNVGDLGSIPGSGRSPPLEKEMATYSSILAWRIPRMEEPGGLQSTGLQRVGHDWVTSLTSLWIAYKCSLQILGLLWKFARDTSHELGSSMDEVNFWQFLHPPCFPWKNFPFSFSLSRSRQELSLLSTEV